MPGVADMDKASFVDSYGGVFEHSPWVAERVWEQGWRGSTGQELTEAFGQVIRSADRGRQLALLHAHPQLALGVAGDKELTEHSKKEQHGAGLDRCSPAEFEEFRRLNNAYTDKFGFPFIIAVKGLGRTEILESFRARLERSPEKEFHEALEQVIRIGRFRLEDMRSARGGGDGF